METKTINIVLFVALCAMIIVFNIKMQKYQRLRMRKAMREAIMQYEKNKKELQEQPENEENELNEVAE